jgi:hypothetical protein
LGLKDVIIARIFRVVCIEEYGEVDMASKPASAAADYMETVAQLWSFEASSTFEHHPQKEDPTSILALAPPAA